MHLFHLQSPHRFNFYNYKYSIRVINIKKLWPFIREMFILIFVIGMLILGLSYNNLITITFKWHILSVSFIMIMFVLAIIVFPKIIIRGINAILDLLFKNKEQQICYIIDQFPYPSSVFTERTTKNYTFEREMRYCIVIKTLDNKLKTLISTDYIPYDKKIKYSVTYWKRSKVILTIISL